MPSTTREQVGIFWRLVTPYFKSRDPVAVRIEPLGELLVKEGWIGCALLAAVVAAELAQVGLTVLFNQWNAVFFDALQNKDLPVFWRQLAAFAVIAAAFMTIAVFQLYLNQWLQIRWRRWMTERYLDHWLADGTHYRMRQAGDAADNPDQRIADDITMFVEQTLSLGLGLLSALTTLASFGIILWGISQEVPLAIDGQTFAVSGYLVWIAAAFAAVATLGAHLIGRPLVGLDFRQQRLGADFRYALVRVRQHSEQIALLGGEPAEREQLAGRFARIVDNWHAVMSRQKTLTFFTAGYNQIAVILPYLILARPFFSGAIQLGTLMQTAGAFAQVHNSLSFLVTSYARLAAWKAVVDRLSGFETQTQRAAQAQATRGIAHCSAHPKTALHLTDVYVTTPDGSPLLTVADLAVPAGTTLLLKGPSGCGKTTLLRAICGFWPHACGRVALAPDARVLMLPQKPYLPLGTLRAVLAYPACEHDVTDDRLWSVLAKVGLVELIPSLGRDAPWSDILSPGEQQRLGFARALLVRPDVLLLDEATSALDEPSEATLLHILEAELPHASILSTGHRSTLAALHHHCVDLKPPLAVAPPV